MTDRRTKDEINKEESYYNNFGLESKNLSQREKNEVLAEDMYSNNNVLEISYSNSPLLVFYRLIKGLLTPSHNHIATHAIIEGSIFQKSLIRKLTVFSFLPFLAIMLSVLFLGTIFSGINTENIKINMMSIGIILVLSAIFLGFIQIFISLISFLYLLGNKLIFKKKIDKIKLKVILAYWIAILFVTSCMAWVVSLFLSLSAPIFGMSVSIFLHTGLFSLILWMYHRSIAYALEIKTYQFILLNILVYGMIAGIVIIIVNSLS